MGLDLDSVKWGRSRYTNLRFIKHGLDREKGSELTEHVGLDRKRRGPL